MAYSQTKLGRARLKAQSALGTPVAAASFAAGDTLECAVFIPPLVAETLTQEAFRGQFHAHRIEAGSKKGVEIPFEMSCHGLSSAAPTANPTSTPDALILTQALGNGVGSSYVSASLAASGTVSVLNVADSAGYTIGAAVLVPLAAGGYGIGWVTDTGTGTVDLLCPLPSVPADTGAVLGSWTASLGTAPTSNGLTMLWVGSRGEQVRLFDGEVAGLNLNIQRGQLVGMSGTLRFCAWVVDAASGTAPGAYAFDLPVIPAVLGRNGARVLVDGDVVAYSTAELAVEITLTELPDLGADEGVAGYAITDRAVRLTMTRHEVDFSALGSPGDILGPVQVDLSTTPGRAMSILIPSGKLQDSPALSDMDGLIGQTQIIVPHVFTSDGSSTAPGNTPARVALL